VIVAVCRVIEGWDRGGGLRPSAQRVAAPRRGARFFIGAADSQQEYLGDRRQM